MSLKRSIYLTVFLICVILSAGKVVAEEPLPEQRNDVERAYNWLEMQQSTNRTFFFFTSGLLPSYEGWADCFTYDQALACIAFVKHGDFKKARLILDFYNKTYEGEIKKYGKFIGYSDAYKKNGAWGETWAAGPNAWLLIAIEQYTYYKKDLKYLELAKKIADWLISLEAADGGIIGGYYGNHEPMTWIAAEHNFDCYTAFRDLGILTGDDRYLKVAKEIKLWLENGAWNKEQNRFNMGKDNPNFATDLSSWAVLSLGKKYGPTLDFAIEKSLTKKLYKVKDVEIEGFDFGSTYEKSHYPDKDAVWLEGTGQMVLAFDRAGRIEEKNHFLAELDKTLTQSPKYKNASGLPYATNKGTPAYGSWLMEDKPLCVSSTAWYIFAKENYNPFSMDQKEEAADKVVDDLAYQPNYQFVPEVDNFEYSSIKFETAYPKQAIQTNKARLGRSQESATVKGGADSLKLLFQPEAGAMNSWAMVSRPFLYPQDWSKYGKLNLWIRCENSVALRVEVKDKEAEPFETRPVYMDKGDWKRLSFDLKDDFVRGPFMPNYGNSKFDKEEVREISFKLGPRDNTEQTVIYIDEVTLE